MEFTSFNLHSCFAPNFEVGYIISKKKYILERPLENGIQLLLGCLKSADQNLLVALQSIPVIRNLSTCFRSSLSLSIFNKSALEINGKGRLCSGYRKCKQIKELKI